MDTDRLEAKLESQLEMLFSDMALPMSTAGAAGHIRRRVSQTGPLLKRNLRQQAARVPSWLGFAVAAIITLVNGGVLALSTFLPSASVNAAASIPNPVVAPIETARPTPTDEASAEAITLVSPAATNTAVAAPADTASPTDTPAPTPTFTPTPTLAPVQRVYTATITPVPAGAIGLAEIPTPAPLVPMPEKAINIVLMGSDQRPYEQQWRTDVIIIVSVNPEIPSVSMLSIPRDTWLYIPNWTHQRINLADVHGTIVGYPGGGPGLVKATIEYNFGIHVDYFARVNFAGLIRIVDTLGGINVLLDCPVEDGFPDNPITEDPSVVTQISYPEPGLYEIDGKHALWLARSRKTTSEFARSQRQHRILQGIWVKAQELGFITRLPELWDELTATVETDLDLEQVLWLASVGMKLSPSQIHSGFIDGRYLTAWVSPGGANVLIPDTEAILEALEPLFNPYPYQAPQGFSKIEVWNGSGHENFGLLAADRLLRNGFEVTDIRKADEVWESTTIMDFTTSSKGSPLPLLQSLLNAQAVQATNEGGQQNEASFRLIVGADYQPCEWPTPARWPTPVPTAAP